MTMNSLKETGAEIGNTLATVLAPVLKDISAALKAFAEMWSKIPAPVQQTIVKIALVAAAIGPILVVVGKIISAVGTIMTIIPQVSAAIGVAFYDTKTDTDVSNVFMRADKEMYECKKEMKASRT